MSPRLVLRASALIIWRTSSIRFAGRSIFTCQSAPCSRAHHATHSSNESRNGAQSPPEPDPDAGLESRCL